jgi:hypothetical protein
MRQPSSFFTNPIACSCNHIESNDYCKRPTGIGTKWLTPCNPLKTGTIVVAVLLPYVVKTPAANVVILAS